MADEEQWPGLSPFVLGGVFALTILSMSLVPSSYQTLNGTLSSLVLKVAPVSWLVVWVALARRHFSTPGPSLPERW